MKNKVGAYLLSSLLMAGGIVSGSSQSSADTYQVTGPVLAVDAKKIIVQKGDEKWEIARDASTKVEGDLKVGSKVTVKYRMTATRIESKSDGAEKPSKGKK